MHNNEDSNIVKISSEENDNYSDDSLYNINSWGADLSFREIITMYDEKELKKPELQRKYVWDRSEASRFIESILMGLPIPSIFLAKVGKNKLIIDGYQRIMTVYDYVKRGKFAEEGKVFKLSNSDKINKRWRGKAFSELTDDEQIMIKSTTIHAIIFEQRHPENDDTSLYQIFERINTSGRTLMPQEIRNCIYQGAFNSMLFELNENPKWRSLYGLINADSRMRDMELILRFFALKDFDQKKIRTQQISLKKYLNLYMGSNESQKSEVLEKRRTMFIRTMDFIYENLGKNAFHNITSKGDYIERFHPTIFDSIAIATAYALEKNDKLAGSNLVDLKLRLLNDDQYKDFISERTTNVDHISGRIAKTLEVLYEYNYE